MPRNEIHPHDLDTLRDILVRHVPGREIRVIGSRASGHVKPFSDLDLVIMGDAPLPLQVRGALRDELAESNLPFAVDLVEWATSSEGFRRVIRRDARAL